MGSPDRQPKLKVKSDFMRPDNCPARNISPIKSWLIYPRSARVRSPNHLDRPQPKNQFKTPPKMAKMGLPDKLVPFRRLKLHGHLCKQAVPKCWSLWLARGLQVVILGTMGWEELCKLPANLSILKKWRKWMKSNKKSWRRPRRDLLRFKVGKVAKILNLSKIPAKKKTMI